MGSVRFLSDWSHEQDGDIHPGEPLLIEYAEERLPKCRARRYGQDSWSILAFTRFHPGDRKEIYGVVKRGAVTVGVPVDATKIELWFKNNDSGGCIAWDSQYGQNYWLNVTPV